MQKRLNTNGLRYHDAHRPVYKVGLTSGSGGDHYVDAKAAGCDTYITADIKYDIFLQAKEDGINLIDGDHFCTETVVTPVLQKLIAEAFPEIIVSVSKRHVQTAQFFTA